MFLSCGISLLQVFSCYFCTSKMADRNFVPSCCPVLATHPLSMQLPFTSEYIADELSTADIYFRYSSSSVRYTRRQLFLLRPPRSSRLSDDLFGVLRHMGLLRRRRGTAAGSRVDKLRGIPVVVPRERQQRQHCWSRMQTVRTLTEVTTQPPAADMSVAGLGQTTRLGHSGIPSIYILNPTSLAKPHAIEQLTLDVNAYDADVIIITESWLKK